MTTSSELRTSRLPSTPEDHTPNGKWTAPVLIAALLGLAGVGVGAYAIATIPAKTSGPQGPRGATGAQGIAGPQGATGAKGATGPAGTVGETAVVAAPALTSTPDPAVGTVLAAKTSCPAGQVLLSGGAQVSAPGVQADRNVELRSSFPLNKTQWQTVALVTGKLGAGVSMKMQPFVTCGLPATTATSAPTSASA
jgi:hypothetical protein